MNTFNELVRFAKNNGINFGYFDEPDVIESSFDFNGLEFINTETFEIPCCIIPDNALIMCINTPFDMTPDDTGLSYDEYRNVILDLINIQKPTYIAVDGAYVKLMCWCDLDMSDTYKKPTLEEFIACCKEALENVRKDSTYNGEPLDFRCTKSNNNDPTPYICTDVDSDKALAKMFDWLSDCNGIDDYWDCEIYINYKDDESSWGWADTADAGVIYDGKSMRSYY